MNNKSIFKSIISIFLLTLFFVSCDKDFNTIGSDIIDDNHFGFELDTLSSTVAFVQPTGVVQTNNLTINELGVYNNPVFGKTKANFVTQLTFAANNENPKFDLTLNPTIESVILAVPYFSKKTSTDASGTGIYTLDSIYGNKTLNLKVYESGYQIQDYDPSTNAQDAQIYYNNQDNLFNNNKIGSPLNNDPDKKQNIEFIPDNSEVIVYKRDNLLKPTTDVESRLKPRMHLKLNKDYFYNKIILAPNDKLVSNGSLRDYIKGLYFQVEDVSDGRLMKLDFATGNITITYKQYESLVTVTTTPGNTIKVPLTFDHDSDPTTPKVIKYVLKTLTFNLKGNSVNLLDQTNSNNYASAILNTNPVTGDKKLNLKGGAEGSIAVIDLFGKPNELANLKKKGWLVNEANLVFYVDKTAMVTAIEPSRVYLYDLKNHRPVLDYATDLSSNRDTKLSKVIHGGILEKENVVNGRGIKYKIRITNHIRNLINKDSTNVRLGLAVSESILITSNAKLKNAAMPTTINRIPLSDVMNPLGTVLYGSNYPFGEADYKYRLKLEIYYTKLN